jgi:hypothetical protein
MSVVRSRGNGANQRTTAFWIASDGEELVGRIAACVWLTSQGNATDAPASLEADSGRPASIGFFEAKDRQDVADALFETALAWVKQQGGRSVVGPASFSPMEEECGLLIDGFEHPHFIGDAANPPYYRSLWERAGWNDEMELLGFPIDVDQEPPAAIQRVAEIAQRRLGVSVRSVAGRSDFVRVMSEMLHPSRSPLANTWGWMPLDVPEIEHSAKRTWPFVVPEMTLVAEVGQGRRLAGLTMTLADLGHVLSRRDDGRLGPIGTWQMLRARRNAPRVRFVFISIFADEEIRGVGPSLYCNMLNAARKRGVGSPVEASWTAANNIRMLKLPEIAGLQPYKRWKVYARDC